MHPAQLLESKRHWNVAPASLAENPKVAEVVVTVPVGPEVIVVSGGVVSHTAPFGQHRGRASTGFWITTLVNMAATNSTRATSARHRLAGLR